MKPIKEKKMFFYSKMFLSVLELHNLNFPKNVSASFEHFESKGEPDNSGCIYGLGFLAMGTFSLFINLEDVIVQMLDHCLSWKLFM